MIIYIESGKKKKILINRCPTSPVARDAHDVAIDRARSVCFASADVPDSPVDCSAGG